MIFLCIFHESCLIVCRKITSSLYTETRQFHLLKVQCNFWNRFRFLNKHLIFSGGFRRIFSQNLRQFQTVGYLVFLKPYPAAGYIDTGKFWAFPVYVLFPLASAAILVLRKLLCFLIMCIHASGISNPLSLLMLLRWIAAEHCDPRVMRNHSTTSPDTDKQEVQKWCKASIWSLVFRFGARLISNIHQTVFITVYYSLCRMARPSGVLMCLLFVAVYEKFCLADGEVDQCIKGAFHKDKPSPEGPDYVECKPWKENTCCTANFTAELKRSNVEVLYNFSWNHCKNLSQVRCVFRNNINCFFFPRGGIFLGCKERGGI